jgi:hypothetical protein
MDIRFRKRKIVNQPMRLTASFTASCIASRVSVTPRIALHEAHRTIATGNEPPEDGKLRVSLSIPALSLQCGQIPCNGIPSIAIPPKCVMSQPLHRAVNRLLRGKYESE